MNSGATRREVRDAPRSYLRGLLPRVPRFRRKSRREWRSEARSDPEAVRAFVTLGKRIRLLREKKNLSLEELAEEARLSPQHLLDIEHGRTNATVATLVGVARGLGVRLRDLFESA